MSGGRHRARAIRPLVALPCSDGDSLRLADVSSNRRRKPTRVATRRPAIGGASTPSRPINAADLAAVRNWYQGGTPQVWGRYISDIGGALTTTEMNYAAQNGIYLYLLVADRNNSSPLVCGRDSTRPMRSPMPRPRSPRRPALHVKAGAVLFKDFEQTQCPERTLGGVHPGLVPDRGGVELRRRLLRQLLQPEPTSSRRRSVRAAAAPSRA